MPQNPQPRTRGELLASIERRAEQKGNEDLGPDYFLPVIQDYNVRAQQLRACEDGRLDDRARFVAAERVTRWQAYVEEIKNGLAEAAGRDFDREHPPVAVPELVGLDEAKGIVERVRAKKGRSAA